MRACGPEHLRASQTCYCLKLPRACRSRSPSKKFDCCKNNSKLFSRLRSRSLTELTRQITPPTKNGHAPPPIESRKSFQSVNFPCVRAGQVVPCCQIKPQAPRLVVPFRQFL